MIWVIIALCVVLIIISIIIDESDLAVASTIIAFLLFVAYMVTFSISVETNADLRAFAQQNRQIYAEVAELTKVMVAGNPSTQAGEQLVDGKSWQQVKVASDRLQELRDSIVIYNRSLRSKREYASYWYLRMWIAEPPKELEYMDLTSLGKK